MKIAKLAAALAAGWLAASGAIAQDIQSRTIKVGIGLTADHPQGQSVSMDRLVSRLVQIDKFAALKEE